MLTLAVFTRIDWLILLGYFALVATVGALASRRRSDAEGYFLAGRSMPGWAISLSVVATTLSVATFLGAPQQSYAGDLSYLVLYIGGFAAVFIVVGVFVPRLYAAKTVTIYGYINNRFGETSRIAVSCMFLLGRLLASGVRLFYAAIPVCLLLYSDPNSNAAYHADRWQLIWAILLIGVIGTAYTVAGGIRAVIWTDTIQVLVIIGTLGVSIWLLASSIPLSAGQMVDVLAHSPGPYHDGGSKLRVIDFSFAASHSFTFWTALIGATFLNTAWFGVDHDLAQRMLTAKSAWRGGASLIASQFVSIIVVSLFLLVGLLLFIFYKRPDMMGAAAPLDHPAASSQVFAHFLLHHMPVGLAGLAMAGMFAIAQGSLDSAINAMASSAVADLYWPIRAKMGLGVDATPNAHAPRLAVAAMGGLLLLFAVAASLVYNEKGTTLLDFALNIMSFAYSGMLAVFLTALLTRRGNTLSVLLALLTGVLVTLVLFDTVLPWWTGKFFGHPFKLAGFWTFPIATIAAFAVCIAGRGRPTTPGRIQHTRPIAHS